MKSIYVKNMLKSYLKKKMRIVIWLIIFVLVFGALGVIKGHPDKVSEAVSAQVQAYQAALQQYDNKIAAMEKDIELAQSQVDAQEAYIDESVLMQIDYQNEYYVFSYFLVTPPAGEDDETVVNTVVTAFKDYFWGGSFKSEIAEELGNISDMSLSEIVEFSVVDNTFAIGVKHFDQKQAEQIAQMVEDRILGQKDNLVPICGPFEVYRIQSDSYARTDLTLLSSQNSSRSTLSVLRNTLKDKQDQLLVLQTQKASYEKTNKPVDAPATSAKKALVIFGVFGVFAGLVVPLAAYAVYYTISNRIKSKEEMIAAGLNVIGSCRADKDNNSCLERMVMQLSLYAKQREQSSVTVGILGDDAKQIQISDELKAKLEKENIETSVVCLGQESVEELDHLIETGALLLVVETGHTRYEQIEEQIQMCRKFDITVWGYLVIE